MIKPTSRAPEWAGRKRARPPWPVRPGSAAAHGRGEPIPPSAGPAPCVSSGAGTFRQAATAPPAGRDPPADPAHLGSLALNQLARGRCPGEAPVIRTGLEVGCECIAASRDGLRASEHTADKPSLTIT